MRLILIFIINLLWFSDLTSQSYLTIQQTDKKTQKCFQKGKDAQSKKDYDKAIQHYNKILKKDPSVIDANLEMGTCLLGKKNKVQAIQYFEKVVSLEPSYEPKVLFTLYKLYNENRNNSKAIESLNAYNNLLSKDDKRKKKVINLLKQLTVRDSLMANPVDYNPIALGEKINSNFLEYLPAITADNAKLIFTRKDQRQEDFYLATLNQDSIISVIGLNELNTNGNEGAHCISQDGKLIIFTACDRRDGKGSCDLYYSSLRDGTWTKPKNLGSKINTESWESQPSLSANGQTLYFASSRPGGKGGKDIWVSTLVDRRWTTPVNLSGNINTSGDEASPFIHPDNQTLYFRSNEHPGMGGFDIFFSQRGSTGFDKVQNIGYPINTTRDEGALFVSLEGDKAYYASDPTPGNLDIFSFTIPDYAKPIPSSYVKLRVKDAVTDLPIAAHITIIDLSSSDTLLHKRADEQGEILATITHGTEYAIYVELNGYIFYSENISFQEMQIIDPLNKDVRLIPIEENHYNSPAPSVPIILKNIFFASGSAELLENSMGEINKLRKLLFENTNMKIQIIGHTDNIGNNQDNLRLSTDRALAVKAAIEKQGISNHRLSAIGLGESDPIATNDTGKGRSLNRRTTFIILSN